LQNGDTNNSNIVIYKLYHDKIFKDECSVTARTRWSQIRVRNSSFSLSLS